MHKLKVKKVSGMERKALTEDQAVWNVQDTEAHFVVPGCCQSQQKPWK